MRLSTRQKKTAVKLAALLVITAIGFFVQKPAPPTVLGTIAPGYYKVTDVADGDTISVDMAGKTERIRLIGVDTPETHDPRKPVQCFGKAASDFTKNLVGDQPVRLVADEFSTNRDRYDRLLRYAYLPDGRLVQAEIIRQGYGFAYTNFPFTKAEEFKRLQSEARGAGAGLWSSCQPVPNDRGGFTSNDE